jgi:sugar O-acyltransferase (sialic acid O-acetyltransferase NeuD family)
VPPRDIAIVSLEWDVVDLIESCGEFAVRGFFDPAGDAASREFEWLGDDANWAAARARWPSLRVALAIDHPQARARLFDHYGRDAIVTIRSPHAYISPRASIGHGCVVQRGVTIMAYARIGTACKINVNATIHHDARVGDFCTIAPGAQLLGNVHVGDRTYVGAGAVVRQRCSIGADAVVGAGAVVVADVPMHATVVGVPASRRLK